MPTVKIPLLDFGDYRAGGAARDRFVSALGASLEEYGFVNIEGHGTSAATLDQAYDAARALFALPEEAKLQCEDPASGRQRGYTPFGVERAKDRATPDLKEFFQIGPEVADDHPLRGDLPPNRLPPQAPEASQTLRAFWANQHAFAVDLLEAIGAWLDLDPGFVRDMVDHGNSVLRVIHYPDVGPVEAGAVRAAQHEDINLLTVLPASTRPGLELMTRDGQWMAIETPPGVMVCDTGDMMKRLTGGRLPATTHRVVNPEASDGGRLSMPFFLHPRPDFLIEPMSGDEAPITARDFLRQRLIENGVA